MAQATSQLRILAQPQVLHRERYTSELDPRRNRPQRFIRADPNERNFEHPTLEVSQQWPFHRKLYFRVTLATVPNEQVNVICIHPYSIDPEDTVENVIKDVNKNTLYFPITEHDVSEGYKSFRITRKKTVQHELRNYGPLRLLDTNQQDIPRLDDPTDARKLIEIYQLGKSQLVFSLAELVVGNPIPVIYDATKVLSNIMTAMAPTGSASVDETTFKCVPQRGLWEGGDEVLMVLPTARIDRRRSFRIIFEHSSAENIEGITPGFVDTRTISFITPPCPAEFTGQTSVEVPFVLIHGNEEIARVNFLYQLLGQNFVTDEQPTLMEQYFDDPNDSISSLDFSFY